MSQCPVLSLKWHLGNSLVISRSIKTERINLAFIGNFALEPLDYLPTFDTSIWAYQHNICQLILKENIADSLSNHLKSMKYGVWQYN